MRPKEFSIFKGGKERILVQVEFNEGRVGNRMR